MSAPERPPIGSPCQYVEGENAETVHAAIVVAHRTDSADTVDLVVFDDAADNQTRLFKVPEWAGVNANVGYRRIGDA